MRKILFICLIALFALNLTACDDDYIEVEATIIDMYESQGAYYLSIEYEMDGFEAPLTALESVSEDVYSEYQIGDTYIFRRPKPGDIYKSS